VFAGQRPAMVITIEPMISVRTDRNAASPDGARWLLKCGGDNLDAQMPCVGCSLAGAGSAARARRVGDRGELQTRRFSRVPRGCAALAAHETPESFVESLADCRGVLR
jgi:hypothetical protein